MKKSTSTRLQILERAFALIYVKGYQTTSVDEIIATTAVTKGAFYYHFKSKDEMGLAIIEELLRPNFSNSFIAPLQKEGHPFDLIYNLMYTMLMEDPFLKVEYGCPASNFTQEMAPWHVDFTIALNSLSKELELAMVRVIAEAQEQKQIPPAVNPQQIALFVMAGYWGIRNIGKLVNAKDVYLPYLAQLKLYFDQQR